MAYNNTNNQNGKGKSTNTTGYQFYNDEVQSVYKSTLAIGYYDRFITIRINPSLPEEKKTNTSRYDYDTNVQTALTADKAMALLKGIEEKIYPAINNGKNRAVGVPVGADGIVSVAYSADEGITTIGLFKGLDPETRKPKEHLSYQFKPTMLVENYDPNSGEFTSENVDSEFMVFVGFLEKFVSEVGMATIHMERYTDRYFREKLAGGSSNNNNYRNYNSNGVFGNNGGGNNNQSQNNPPQENVQYGDQIDSFLD